MPRKRLLAAVIASSFTLLAQTPEVRAMWVQRGSLISRASIVAVIDTA